MAVKRCHIKDCKNIPTTTIKFRGQRVPVCDEHKNIKG